MKRPNFLLANGKAKIRPFSRLAQSSSIRQSQFRFLKVGILLKKHSPTIQTFFLCFRKQRQAQPAPTATQDFARFLRSQRQEGLRFGISLLISGLRLGTGKAEFPSFFWQS